MELSLFIFFPLSYVLSMHGDQAIAIIILIVHILIPIILHLIEALLFFHMLSSIHYQR